MLTIFCVSVVIYFALFIWQLFVEKYTLQKLKEEWKVNCFWMILGTVCGFIPVFNLVFNLILISWTTLCNQNEPRSVSLSELWCVTSLERRCYKI